MSQGSLMSMWNLCPSLSKPTSDFTNPVYIDMLKSASTAPRSVVHQIKSKPSWIDPVLAFLKDNVLPPNSKEARSTNASKVVHYYLYDRLLYKKYFTQPLLKCLRLSKAWEAMKEVHDGIYESHISRRAMHYNVLRRGNFCPNMPKSGVDDAQKCENGQRHANT
ncbi:hypothetical protein NE237_023931 [Protea cynaroides]|uniref:Uncharacterized protein n=1 Tax=Protea cynaroides TaxID=273540 RepID=A0A9Q0K5V7_9MAGN|nr:hypothetical protein NE237_023931 [Protea cynaroides]